MALRLIDIRCGCGGLCDSQEPCPMRGNVNACVCGHTVLIHARGQMGCCYFSHDRIVDAWERDEYAKRELRRD